MWRKLFQRPSLHFQFKLTVSKLKIEERSFERIIFTWIKGSTTTVEKLTHLQVQINPSPPTSVLHMDSQDFIYCTCTTESYALLAFQSSIRIQEKIFHFSFHRCMQNSLSYSPVYNKLEFLIFHLIYIYRERKVKTLTRNWRDHRRTGTHKRTETVSRYFDTVCVCLSFCDFFNSW